MSTVGASYLNIADINKLTYPDGSPVQMVIDLTMQQNQIIEDIPWLPCNNGHQHITTVQNAIPSPTWVGIYDFVGTGKAAWADYTDTTGMMEAWSEVSERLLNLNMKAAPKTLSLTNAAFIEGMTQEYVRTIIYGDERDSTNNRTKSFTGFAPRFASLSTGYSDRVISAGGSTNLTSMWFVTWGEPYCHGIYPEGTMTGIETEDLGIETKTDSNGNMMRVARQKYTWRGGLAVRDPRAIVRICNIDTVAGLTAGSGSDTSTDLWRLMVRAYHKLINPAMRLPLGATRIYCNATIMEILDLLARKTVGSTSGIGLSYDTIDGRLVLNFRGIPIKRVDQITNSETAVS